MAVTTAGRLTSPASPAPPSFSTRRTSSPWTGTSKRHPCCVLGVLFEESLLFTSFKKSYKLFHGVVSPILSDYELVYSVYCHKRTVTSILSQVLIMTGSGRVREDSLKENL